LLPSLPPSWDMVLKAAVKTPRVVYSHFFHYFTIRFASLRSHSGGRNDINLEEKKAQRYIIDHIKYSNKFSPFFSLFFHRRTKKKRWMYVDEEVKNVLHALLSARLFFFFALFYEQVENKSDCLKNRRHDAVAHVLWIT
jgi:hypothetical protein